MSCRIFAVIRPASMQEVARQLNIPIPAQGNRLWVEVDLKRFPTFMVAEQNSEVNVGSKYEEIIHMA